MQCDGVRVRSADFFPSQFLSIFVVNFLFGKLFIPPLALQRYIVSFKDGVRGPEDQLACQRGAT